jgi:hypothetical protein
MVLSAPIPVTVSAVTHTTSRDPLGGVNDADVMSVFSEGWPAHRATESSTEIAISSRLSGEPGRNARIALLSDLLEPLPSVGRGDLTRSERDARVVDHKRCAERGRCMLLGHEHASVDHAPAGSRVVDRTGPLDFVLLDGDRGVSG